MKYIKMLYRFLRDIYQNRQLLAELVKNDFKSRYLNNYLGIFWAFIQPTITILIFWFVFQVGFRATPIEGTPFILWLVAGILPWFFIAEAVVSSSKAILDNAYLVKKIVFRIHLLPIVKIISSATIHLFFIFFMMFMYLAYSFEPTLFWLQIIYYFFATLVFLLGVAWITSSIIVFFRDLEQLIGMAMQFGFWLTPIFWSLDMIPQTYLVWFKLNPAYYITQGYRDTFINHIWFWEKPLETLQFWGISLVVFIAGAIIFRRLRPHFADVI
ncbi:ABC transporter permease [Sulfurospirillum sp.]|uniref:ABC transporter permease n=1 Tax=Sulfurospirillum sp. TaxID=2053622 RepID=UPI002FDEED0C